MKIHDCLQGSTEWLNLRAGIPTASEFDKILTPSGKASASSDKYLFALLAERMMGHPRIEAVSTWMNRGQEMEEEAIGFYELTREAETVPVGFVTNDAGTIGASPDRLVGSAGLVEFKVPSEAVHVMYLLQDGKAYLEYKVQVQGQLWIAEREWVDLVSFHPEMPPAIIRIERDETFISVLKLAVEEFSARLENLSEELVKRGWIKAWPIPLEIIIPADQTGFLSEEDLAYAESLVQKGEHDGSSRGQRPSSLTEIANRETDRTAKAFVGTTEGYRQTAENYRGRTEDPSEEPGIGRVGKFDLPASGSSGRGMIEPDYSKDPPPPCPLCGGETRLIGPGISKHWKPQWGGAKWRCKNCPKRTKGCGVDAAKWHDQISGLSEALSEASPQPEDGERNEPAVVSRAEPLPAFDDPMQEEIDGLKEWAARQTGLTAWQVTAYVDYALRGVQQTNERVRAVLLAAQKLPTQKLKETILKVEESAQTRL